MLEDNSKKLQVEHIFFCRISFLSKYFLLHFLLQDRLGTDRDRDELEATFTLFQVFLVLILVFLLFAMYLSFYIFSTIVLVIIDVLILLGGCSQVGQPERQGHAGTSQLGKDSRQQQVHFSQTKTKKQKSQLGKNPCQQQVYSHHCHFHLPDCFAVYILFLDHCHCFFFIMIIISVIIIYIIFNCHQQV